MVGGSGWRIGGGGLEGGWRWRLEEETGGGLEWRLEEV